MTLLTNWGSLPVRRSVFVNQRHRTQRRAASQSGAAPFFATLVSPIEAYSAGGRRGVLHYCVFCRGGLRQMDASHSAPLRLTRELRGGVEQSRLRRRGDGAVCSDRFACRRRSARGVQDDPKQAISGSFRRRGVACRERYRVRVRRHRSDLLVATPSSRVSADQDAPAVFLGRVSPTTCRSR